MPETVPAPTIFDAASLQRHIEAVFTDVPAAHRTALVGYYTRDGKWRVSVAHRLGTTWVLGATLGRDSVSGNIDGGVILRGSW